MTNERVIVFFKGYLHLLNFLLAHFNYKVLTVIFLSPTIPFSKRIPDPPEINSGTYSSSMLFS